MPHGPVGAGKNTEPCGSSHNAHGLEDRCVEAALPVKISVRFKPAAQGWMHDLRQRHCPIITPPLLCLKRPGPASLLLSHCQSECKIIAKNKIYREVKLLACDLMWKICVLFLPLVNSRKNGDEHPSLLAMRSRLLIK